MAYDNFLIDKRVVDRYIAKGLVDADEYKRIVEALPDRENNCVHVSLEGDSGASAAASSTGGVSAAVASEGAEADEGEDLDDEEDEEDDDDDEEDDDDGEGGDESP